MNNLYIKHIISFLLLFLFQILFMNKIALFGFITPMVYILFILSLPFDTPKWAMIVICFGSGLIMDFFTGVLGMHALSLMTLGLFRHLIIRSIPFRGEIEPHLRPILYDMKFVWYIQYIVILVLIHHFVYYVIDSMSFSHFFRLLGIVAANSLCTIICILLLQILFYKPSKRY